MKTLFVNISYLPTIGGVEVIMHNLAKGLVAKGHGVAVITANTLDLKSAKLKKEENIDGVKVRRIKAFQLLPRTNPWLTPKIFSAIANADIVHVFSYHPAFITNAAYIAAKIKKLPLVVTPIFHPLNSLPNLRFHQKFWTSLYRKVVGPKILRLADAVTALTKTEADFYRSKSLKNVLVIPEAVPLKTETIRQSGLQGFRKKFGIGDARIIICVGRIVKYKGLDILVRAFASSREVLPDAQLIIVGKDQGYRQELAEIIRELSCQDNIVFTGDISNEELYCAYEVADAVVHPSLFEAFCRIALEAWSHKKAIIVFDKVGEPVSEETGILVKYGDVEGLAKAIIKLLSDEALRQNLGQKGHEQVQKFYNWDKVVSDLEQVYGSLAGKRITSQDTRESG